MNGYTVRFTDHNGILLSLLKKENLLFAVTA